MVSDRSQYGNPLVERYASAEMSAVFSPDFKFRTWRRLWIALAECEKELGLEITDGQIQALKDNAETIDYDVAAKWEKDLKHDVMAHIKAYGEVAPEAAGIIHLGATSAYVGDNTDLVQIREGLGLVRTKLLAVMASLAKQADAWRNLPTVAFTHFQPAQLTTVGKRMTLWLNELWMDLRDLDHRISELAFLGVKGATGTQASFLSLFEGDAEKVERLDQMVAERMGFEKRIPVSGQTYSRKIDAKVLGVLADIAASCHKFAVDMRLLQHIGEIDEPFGSKQVGSSAMAYKRNPMKAERMTSLARFVMGLLDAAQQTSAQQWFERTLDDSAGRRIFIPEAFLGVDAILTLYQYVVQNLVVHEDVVNRNVQRELPFMATENLLMEAVKAGGDRQELHEVIRTHSLTAVAAVKKGEPNPLLELLRGDAGFAAIADRFDEIVQPAHFIGLAPQQAEALLSQLAPVLSSVSTADAAEIRV
jgi:adenylosuccinate lyase